MFDDVICGKQGTGCTPMPNIQGKLLKISEKKNRHKYNCRHKHVARWFMF